MNYKLEITVGQKAIDTEQQMLNFALYNRVSCSYLAEINPSEFICSEYRDIKKVIDNLIADNKVVSPTSVYNELREPILKDYLAEIAVGKWAGEPETIYNQFKKYHRMCMLEPELENLAHMVKHAHPDFDDAFNNIVDKFNMSVTVQDATLMRELFKAEPDKIKESYVRWKTNIPSLDNKIKWLYGGQYICIAGSAGSGKSTLAGQIAENIPDSLIVSYEMTCEEWHDVMVSRKSSIDSEKIEDDLLDFHEKQIVAGARRELAESSTLRICDVPLNANDMFAFIKVMIRKYRIKCVVIDYAQIIPNITIKGNQTEKFEWLSRKFKLLAREEKVIVIALSQLSKDSIREGRAPNLSDLRGSLSFGNDADKVIFIYEVEDDDGNKETRCALGKNRKGRIGIVDGFRYIKNIHCMG